eukprot:GFUD01024844.1.p1 GENE.GFUD01024844.1~~GFUD01024844.1.p1  ORF type:complete len:365 (+),score=102.88 GFUD01024844.1:102-1097(+)
MEIEEIVNGVDLDVMARRAKLWAAGQTGNREKNPDLVCAENSSAGQGGVPGVQSAGQGGVQSRSLLASGEGPSVVVDTNGGEEIEEDQEPVTELVDLSSNDDLQDDHVEGGAQEGLSFNISDVRSLLPPSCVSAQIPSLSKRNVMSSTSRHCDPDPVNPCSANLSTSTGSSSRPSSSSSHYDSHSTNTHDDVSAHSELRYFKTGPLASLWSYQGSVGPLISPEMGGSLREVYGRLNMDPPANKKYKGRVEELDVTYDLYLAENYKKSHKTLPDYRIIIQTFSSPLPNQKSLAKLESQFPDRVPFLFAVVNGGTVTFFNVDRVELPRYFRDI